jgi:hypothetical protein
MANIQQIEFVLIVSQGMRQVVELIPDKTCHLLNIDNPLFGRFKGFDIIGKLYYKPNDSYTIDSDEIDEVDFV